MLKRDVMARNTGIRQVNMLEDKYYNPVLRVFMFGSCVTCMTFILAFAIAIGPGIDWGLNYEETVCTIDEVYTSGRVECELAGSERSGPNDDGLHEVPCVTVRVNYTNATGDQFFIERALPNREVLQAEISNGGDRAQYAASDYIGPPIEAPDGEVQPRRRSTLNRRLGTTRYCTFMDCRSNFDEAQSIADEIASRYTYGMQIPCWYYVPFQDVPGQPAYVVLNQVQSDQEVFAWTIASSVGLVLTWPCCVFLCCREWWCRCPHPIRRLQYF
mmetsp:Transcript_10206/g.26506  ORF Transcript_10206/g.26506 Transcript_10206/m.26506 type:complete len:272 (+) Transcript_10206:72-887(+)